MLNVHIYPSTFQNETRILKIVRSLKNKKVFSEILIIGRWKEGLQFEESIEPGISVLRIKPIFGHAVGGGVGRFLKAISWYLAVILALSGKRTACINSHSLAVLPLGAFLGFFKKSKVIYDTHELETETVALSGFRQVFARFVERQFIGFADAVSVVNSSICDSYRDMYHLDNLWVVRNVPMDTSTPTKRRGRLRDTIGVASEDLLFIYQGLLSRGRGIEIILESFSRIHDKHVVFMGYGELEDEIKKIASKSSTIHFMPAVAPDVIKDFTVDADVGISLIENVCQSYYLCLPNKLFEYASCGVPVIVSNFPEMAKVVAEYECGWAIPPRSHELGSLVASLSLDRIDSKRVNALSILNFNNWQREERVLLEMYRSLRLI